MGARLYSLLKCHFLKCFDIMHRCDVSMNAIVLDVMMQFSFSAGAYFAHHLAKT